MQSEMIRLKHMFKVADEMRRSKKQTKRRRRKRKKRKKENEQKKKGERDHLYKPFESKNVMVIMASK